MKHLFSGRSVAIIGSSPEILDRQQGAEIDAHDVVMRINLSGIHGRPECLGSRTDVRFLGGRIDRVYASDIRQMAEAGALMLRVKNDWVANLVDTPCHFTGLQMHKWLAINRPKLLLGIDTTQHMTSGSNAIAIALDGGADCVTLYGFSMDPSSRYRHLSHTGEIMSYDPGELRRYHCDPAHEIEVLRRVMRHYPVTTG